MNKRIFYYFFLKEHGYPHHEELENLIKNKPCPVGKIIKNSVDLYIKEKDIVAVAKLLMVTRERVRQHLFKARINYLKVKPLE
jgi:hypothetical protein